ncbi:MAG: phosphohistidine phosphatase SixA [Rhodospirillales bacterium]|nr:phosphohistidine phosphatase SixA [Rhodospirillales bacterium]
MKLYLVQHGEAIAEAEDPERPLSAAGRADVGRLAAFLGNANVAVVRIVASGKLRARQTADALAGLLTRNGAVSEVMTGLRPGDTTEWLADVAEQWRDDSLVVGHMPFLGKMTARLVTGREDDDIVAFTPGTVVCLERQMVDKWSIAWVLAPMLLEGPAIERDVRQTDR